MGSTRGIRRRLAVAGAASALAVGGLLLAATPASAASCSGTSGVTVIVDTGSSISTRCASGDPGSGLSALSAAGFSVTQVQTQPGFVCRINGIPASDPCVRTPPASAYWAFFHAKRGGSWTYSSSGVASYDPAPGTVIGFRFGSGQQPRSAPPAPAQTTAPKPTAKPTPTTEPEPPTSKPKATTKPKATVKPKATTGSTGASTPGASAAPKSSSSASAKGSPSASASRSATPSPSASSSASPSASDSTATGSPPEPSTEASAVALDAAPTSEDGAGGGAGTLLVGGALVALVAGGAGFAAWKRRV